MTFPILPSNSPSGIYSIDNSLRFNDNDSPYLSRTPSSVSDRRTFTFSFWLKRGNLGGSQTLFSNPIDLFYLNSDILGFDFNGAIGGYYYFGNQVFRDVSAWYHIVLAIDTTDATGADRLKLYINGERITPSGSSIPTQNYQTSINNNQIQVIGKRQSNNDRFIDGYLAEFNFIDGQALSPTDFGEFDTDSGIWKPIQYTGSYGTNGFYLDFENSGSLGADQSGNGNNFTPTNLTSTDQTTDTPTNNFATLNPLAKYPNNGILSEGNTTFTGINNASENYNTSTIGFSLGKWYAEFKLTSDADGMNIGVMKTDLYNSTSPHSTTSAWTFARGIKWNNGNQGSYGSTPSTNDILMMAVDMDNGKIWWGLNGTWFASGDPSAGTNEAFSNVSGEVTVLTNDDYSVRTPVCLCNFGNPSFSISSGNSDGNGYGNFEYAPPSGFLALCTQNLATALSPTIDDGSAYFQTKTYTGNGVETAITNDGNSNLQPDLIWFKARSAAYYHGLFDSTRGTELRLSSNVTDAEVTKSSAFTSFDSDGFTVGADVSNTTNASGQTFVAWQWKASGGTTSSNTSGSITSTVQANTTAGFSIVTYTGNGTAGATIGHGLGAVPNVMIVKMRTDAGLNWEVYHSEVSSTPENDFLLLNSTAAKQTASNRWNNTAPTSSVFTVGNGGGVNSSGKNYVAYLFNNVNGYFLAGNYTGNGNSDGVFVYTGFRPAWVMIKRYDSTGGAAWYIFDNKRNTFNVVKNRLVAQDVDTEATNFDALDFLSNGFKFRNNDLGWNTSGGKYIYMCFGANPLVSSSGVPVVAR